jgi:hypothetical protein
LVLYQEDKKERRKQILGSIGEDLLMVGQDQPFRFPAAFTFVVRAFSVLDGIGKGNWPSVPSFRSFVRSFMSFVRSFMSFVRSFMSFVQSCMSFVQSLMSFVKSCMSFVEPFRFPAAFTFVVRASSVHALSVLGKGLWS